MTAVRPSPTRITPRASRVATLDITVLAGGPGPEREVSLHSGRAVYEALLRLGHRVVLRDIGPSDFSALDAEADIIFIALHGEFGEDGTLQAELDRRGLRYCGSGAAASRLAMNKVEAKRRFERAGIPTPAYEVVGRECHGDPLHGAFDQIPAPARLSQENTARAEARGSVSLSVFPIAPPAVVKPVACGSSVDTTIARTRGELHAAAARVADRYGEALVERYIEGPELTVGILGETALPVCEIRTRREFYDYQAKYLDEETQYLFELDLPPALLERVQKVSLEAHRALGCSVFSRVDWMVDGGTLEPYVLEVNTIPGFTSHSLLPKAAARMGLSFEQLCQRIVELSLDRGTKVESRKT